MVTVIIGKKTEATIDNLKANITIIDKASAWTRRETVMIRRGVLVTIDPAEGRRTLRWNGLSEGIVLRMAMPEQAAQFGKVGLEPAPSQMSVHRHRWIIDAMDPSDQHQQVARNRNQGPGP